jgi:NAD(P)-dependent dehydrogenase (short-subunit alcohol dehydrogenase family)
MIGVQSMSRQNDQPEFAIVTGGLGSIGRAIEAQLDQRRIAALLLDRAELNSPILQSSKFFKTDCLDEDELTKIISRAWPTMGRLVAVFHCAGGGDLGEQTSEDPALPSNRDLHAVVANNLFTAFNVVRLSVPILRALGGGSLTFISSVNAYGGFGSPGYSASKAALLGYSRTLAVQLASDKIRVNCVSPGSTDTTGFRDLLEKQGKTSALEALRRRAPLKKLVEADEVARAMISIGFDLVSMTGAEILIDNGQSLRRF